MNTGIVDLADLYNFIRRNKNVPHRTNDKEVYRPFKQLFLESIKNVPPKTGWYHWVKINKDFKSIYIGKSDRNTSYNLFKRIEEELSEEYVALWSTIYNEKDVLNTFNEKYGYKKYNKGRHERAIKKIGTTHIIWNSVSENLDKDEIKIIEGKLINHFKPVANIQKQDFSNIDSKIYDRVKVNFYSLIQKIQDKK